MATFMNFIRTDVGREFTSAYGPRDRFEGARNEINACIREISAHMAANGEAEGSVSDKEIWDLKKMIHEFTDVLVNYAILSNDTYVDENALNDLCGILQDQ